MAVLLKQRGEAVGQEIDKIVLTVDNRIIEHFSRNLYESPYKAIEELVVNGFDAFAESVRVYTPGPFVTDKVLVWDNGSSMSVEGLKQLWWIANSPKNNENRTISRNNKRRQVIGKFGIGKLASYAVGKSISHLCKHDGNYYLITVDYNKIDPANKTTKSRSAISSDTPLEEPVYQLTKDDAQNLFRELFDHPPASLQEMFNATTWTLAVVEDLRKGDLPVGRLMWILGNGMPLRPDFAVSVNDQAVHSKLDKISQTDWNLGSKPVVDAIESHWRTLVESDGLAAVKFDKEIDLDPARPGELVPYAEFGRLGRVWGHIRIFDDSLLKYRTADNGRSHGFFLMVRGRLINPDNDKLYGAEPSFQTFFRSQFVIHADALDADLLADRQRLRQDASSIDELRELQRALMGITRVEVEKKDAEHDKSASTMSRLPVSSRLYYRSPLNALLLKMPLPVETVFDFNNTTIDRLPLGENVTISELAPTEGAFHVNIMHPYYKAIHDVAGQSKVGRELLRTVDLFAVAEKLLEGYLHDIGIPDEYVDNVMEWRDGLLRQLARLYSSATDVIAEMERTSYVGHSAFERAIASVFADMGFRARRDGRPGRKDVLVLATVGRDSYSFTVEAKGSGYEIDNAKAAIGQAARHREDVGADWAIVVARRFSGFHSQKTHDAAVIGECRAAGRVCIVETEALAAIHGAVQKFGYPLLLLRDVLRDIESPVEKMERITTLARPLEDFDYLSLLEEIWRRQREEAEGEPVPFRSVHQQGQWKGKIAFDEFRCRLTALDTLAAGRMLLDLNANEVYLKQSPQIIVDQATRSLQGKGFSVRDDDIGRL